LPFHRAQGEDFRSAGRAGLTDLGGQPVKGDPPGAAEDRFALDGVAEFPDVAGPIIVQQLPAGRGGEAVDLLFNSFSGPEGNSWPGAEHLLPFP